jgi:hypothetical protein
MLNKLKNVFLDKKVGRSGAKWGFFCTFEAKLKNN